jgi:hypothetical protein
VTSSRVVYSGPNGRGVDADGVAPAVLSSLAVFGELTGQVLIAVPMIRLEFRRTLRLVHPAGRVLVGPAKELAGIAQSRHRR